MFIFLFTLLLQLHADVTPINEVFEPKGEFPKEEYVKVAVVQWNPGVSPVPATKKEAESIFNKISNFPTLEKRINETLKKEVLPD